MYPDPLCEASGSFALALLNAPGGGNSYQLNETQFCQNQNSALVQGYIGVLVTVRIFYVYGDQKNKNLCTEYYTDENS